MNKRAIPRILYVVAGLLAVVVGGMLFFNPDGGGPVLTDKDVPKTEVAEPAPSVGTASATDQDEPMVSPPPDSASETASINPTTAELLDDVSLDDAKLRERLGVIVSNAGLPLAERQDALSHLLNLTLDDSYPALLRLAARLQGSDGDVLRDELLTDAFNRPLSLQADLCLVLLQGDAGAALRKVTRDHLVFLVGQDVGEDLEAWRAAVKTAKVTWEAEEQGAP